jgi:hypothetical protein
MTIATLRQELEEARALVQRGQSEQALTKLDKALADLAPETLLTTTKAAELLGIGSVNTLKLMCRQGLIAYRLHGNRTMIPLSEVERLQESPLVRGLRASDRAHEQAAALGTPDGLTPEQLDDLEEARPGRLPWEAAR